MVGLPCPQLNVLATQWGSEKVKLEIHFGEPTALLDHYQQRVPSKDYQLQLNQNITLILGDLHQLSLRAKTLSLPHRFILLPSTSTYNTSRLPTCLQVNLSCLQP